MREISIFLIFINLFVAQPVLAFDFVTIPQENYDASMNDASIISNEEFEMLEKKIFNKSFKTDTPQKRLARLEKEILGMEQKGNVEERFENLITASDYYKAGYRVNSEKQTNPNTYNYFEPQKTTQKSYTTPQKYGIYSYEDNQPIKKSKVKQFFDNLADSITVDSMTGFSPPIYYNGNYMQPMFHNFQRPYYNNMTNYIRPNHMKQYYIPESYKFSRPPYPNMSKYPSYLPGVNSTQGRMGVKIIN